MSPPPHDVSGSERCRSIRRMPHRCLWIRKLFLDSNDVSGFERCFWIRKMFRHSKDVSGFERCLCIHVSESARSSKVSVSSVEVECMRRRGPAVSGFHPVTFRLQPVLAVLNFWMGGSGDDLFFSTSNEAELLRFEQFISLKHVRRNGRGLACMLLLKDDLVASHGCNTCSI